MENQKETVVIEQCEKLEKTEKKVVEKKYLVTFLMLVSCFMGTS